MSSLFSILGQCLHPVKVAAANYFPLFGNKVAWSYFKVGDVGCLNFTGTEYNTET